MEAVVQISERSSIPTRKVLVMRFWRYFRTSMLLHAITLVSIGATIICGNHVRYLLTVKLGWMNLALFSYLTLYFFTLIFFSQFDAYSRFQNYKLIKDKFYEYGFQPRLLKAFVYSKCQRDAISVAASDMDFTGEWKLFVSEMGFRWYHLLPRMVVRSPKILLTRDYWIKTLFVKKHQSKYFLW